MSAHLRGISIIALAAALRVTADANRAGVDLLNYSGHGFLRLNASATEAADNTLNVKLQHSSDDGAADAWADAGIAFAAVTNAAASAQTVEIDIDGLKRYVRVVDDVAGTSPACTRSVDLYAKADRT